MDIDEDLLKLIQDIVSDQSTVELSDTQSIHTVNATSANNSVFNTLNVEPSVIRVPQVLSGLYLPHKKQGFQWTAMVDKVFRSIVQIYGVKTVTPKQILKLLTLKFTQLEQELTRQIVASHLQKLRIKVLRQYGLDDFTKLTDQMVIDLDSSEVLQKVRNQGINLSNYIEFIEYI